MAGKLDGKKVAVVVTDGFEQVELTEPRKALEDAGAVVDVVSPKRDLVRGWNKKQWGDEIAVDVPLAEADPDDYDALVLPGGVMSPDALRVLPAVQKFVRSFFDDGKPVASICHGPWVLVDAHVLRGKKLTSWPSLHADLTNAGAEWLNAEVVVDHGLVTSRKPADLPAFNAKMIEEFAEGPHDEAGMKLRRGPKRSPAPM